MPCQNRVFISGLLAMIWAMEAVNWGASRVSGTLFLWERCMYPLRYMTDELRKESAGLIGHCDALKMGYWGGNLSQGIRCPEVCHETKKMGQERCWKQWGKSQLQRKDRAQMGAIRQFELILRQIMVRSRRPKLETFGGVNFLLKKWEGFFERSW